MTGYEVLVGCLDGAAPTTRPIVLPAERARGKLAGGIPLLHDEDVYLDDGYARAAFDQLLGCALEQADLQDRALGLAEAVRDHRLHVEHAVAEGFVGHWEHVEQLAIHAAVDGDLVTLLVWLVARPMLDAYAERLAPVLALGEWSRGYCPICGSVAGAIEPLNCCMAGLSWALCMRCPTSWWRKLSEGGHGGPPLRGGFRLELAGGEDDEYDD